MKQAILINDNGGTPIDKLIYLVQKVDIALLQSSDINKRRRYAEWVDKYDQAMIYIYVDDDLNKYNKEDFYVVKSEGGEIACISMGILTEEEIKVFLEENEGENTNRE